MQINQKSTGSVGENRYSVKFIFSSQLLFASVLGWGGEVGGVDLQVQLKIEEGTVMIFTVQMPKGMAG